MRRSVVNYPARFDTISGVQDVTLLNVSPRGAKLRLAHAVDLYASGRLQIASYEVYCRVAWCNQLHCGLEFDHDLKQDAIGLITESSSEIVVPVACPELIPHGKKRAGRLVCESANEP